MADSTRGRLFLNKTAAQSLIGAQWLASSIAEQSVNPLLLEDDIIGCLCDAFVLVPSIQYDIPRLVKAEILRIN